MTPKQHAIWRKIQARIQVDPKTGKHFINGNLYLFQQGWTQLPDLSHVELRGSVYCYQNELTSLSGFPAQITGNLWCHNNRITTLHGAPTHVAGDFWCNGNSLTSLHGSPDVGGEFNCSRNPLSSLRGTHFRLGQIIKLGNNPWGLPQEEFKWESHHLHFQGQIQLTSLDL